MAPEGHPLPAGTGAGYWLRWDAGDGSVDEKSDQPWIQKRQVRKKAGSARDRKRSKCVDDAFHFWSAGSWACAGVHGNLGPVQQTLCGHHWCARRVRRSPGAGKAGVPSPGCWSAAQASPAEQERESSRKQRCSRESPAQAHPSSQLGQEGGGNPKQLVLTEYCR